MVGQELESLLPRNVNNRKTLQRAFSSPGLVFQLIDAFPGLEPLVEEQIRRIRELFSKSRKTNALFVEPLISLCNAVPHSTLIITFFSGH